MWMPSRDQATAVRKEPDTQYFILFLNLFPAWCFCRQYLAELLTKQASYTPILLCVLRLAAQQANSVSCSCATAAATGQTHLDLGLHFHFYWNTKSANCEIQDWCRLEGNKQCEQIPLWNPQLCTWQTSTEKKAGNTSNKSNAKYFAQGPLRVKQEPNWPLDLCQISRCCHKAFR